jgi:hypothetical protein
MYDLPKKNLAQANRKSAKGSCDCRMPSHDFTLSN